MNNKAVRRGVRLHGLIYMQNVTNHVEFNLTPVLCFFQINSLTDLTDPCVYMCSVSQINKKQHYPEASLFGKIHFPSRLLESDVGFQIKMNQIPNKLVEVILSTSS